MTTSRPVIGITLDQEPAGGYASVPWYALRENYTDALMAQNATVITLPAHPDSLGDYLALCDGFVISGGGFDIDPALFGAKTVHDSVTLKPERTQFESQLIQSALAADKPVLGICGGEQLLAALLGGKLVQHIPDEIPNALNHSPSGSIHDPVGNRAAHSVSITEGTLLHRICGTTEMDVNSSHHQAVLNENLPSGLRINALAPDGVVEGIESTQHRFCLGVQWHPEYQLTAADTKIMTAFVDACR